MAHAQEPDYIIQSNAAPLTPLVATTASGLAATAATPAPTVPAAAAPLPTAAVAASAPAVAAVAPVTLAAPGARSAGRRVRIALLLPTESKAFGEAASVVRAGFDAAAAVDGGADITYVDEQATDVAARYRAAVAAGARVVVGPLTRQGIAAIAPYVRVPTLTLNALDPAFAKNANLLSLSLTVEGEARQMVGLMRDDGRQAPLVFSAADPLSSRLTQAFVDEWHRQTGGAPRVLDWPPAGSLNQLVGNADSVFVAMTATEAAALKAALPRELTVYGTSQLNVRRPDPTMAGLRFIDMPWFLMPEQREVKRYPRPTSQMPLQTERLYALGIDAYRLAVQLGRGKWNAGTLKLHGVTGDLKLGRDRQFERLLPLAVMMPVNPQ